MKATIQLIITLFISTTFCSAQNYTLDFDGVDDYVDLSTIPSSNNYSIEFWVSFDELTGTDVVLSRDDNSLESYRLYRIHSEIWVRTGTNGGILKRLTNSAEVGRWYHIAIIREGTTSVSTYLDGVNKGGLDILSSNGFTSNMGLGNNGNSDFFNGQIEEFRIWNGPRTHQEIIDNRYKELDGTESNLVVYYKFDDRQALLIDDCTTNGFDGIKRSKTGLELPQPDTSQVNGLIDMSCSNCNSFVQYRDVDGDGYGDINTDTTNCEYILDGYVQDSTDCNDTDSLINILSLEIADGIDNNCNGEIDEPQLSLSFDGIDDYVDLSNVPSSTEYSVEFWVRFDELTGTDVVLSRSDNSFESYRIYRIHSEIWVRTGTNGGILKRLTNSAEVGRWYHIAIIREGTTSVSIYLDGINRGGLDILSSNGFTSNMWLGYNGSGDFFKGQIDEFRIWNGPRTQQQVLDNRYKELDGAESNLVVYYKFDDRQALLIDDCTTNSFDGIKRSSTGLELPVPDTSQVSGLIDESCTNCNSFIQYRDSDKDGYGDINADTIDCEYILDGYVQDNTDCNDLDSLINIEALEISDGIDNNCNGEIDEPQLSIGLDGVDDYIDLSTVPSSNNYSIEFWVRFDELTGTDVVLSRSDNSFESYRIYRIHSEIWVRTGTNGGILKRLTNTAEVGRWYHIAIIRAGTTSVTTYLDGINRGGLDILSSSGFTSNMGLGFNGSGDFFKGQIDEFRIWHGPRTPQEIIDNRNKELSGTEPNLVAYYKFDDDLPVQVTDCTPNDYHGIKSAINSGALPIASIEQASGLVDRTCGDCELIISYRDADGDGFGDSSIDTMACQAIPQGYVSNSSDCNDMDSLLFPGQVWYLDSDGDGFGDETTFLTSCSQPSDYVSNSEDCNDDLDTISPNAVELCDGIDNNCNGEVDEGIINLDYTGTGFFDSLIMYPNVANIEDTIRVEVKYTNVYGHLPALFNPQLLLDYSGNGSYSNSNDFAFVLEQVDSTDTDVTDGKIYFTELVNLPTGQAYISKVVVDGMAGCNDEFGPFAMPDILDPIDVSIFANDITFSDNNPDENTIVTVSATIHNFSSFDAEDIVVRLENTYDGTIYTDIIDLDIPSDTDTTISWMVTTPSVIAFVPFKVSADFSDVLPEPNELDNVAIRPLLVGDFTAGGEIITTSNLNNDYPFAGQRIYLSGTAHYTNLPVTLQDSSVAGAQVEISIAGIDSSIISTTNNIGFYSIPIDVGLTPDTFIVTGVVTDFTLTDSIPEQMFVVKPPVCAADLVPILTFPNAILPEDSLISGTIRVLNQGCADIDTSTIMDVQITNGLPGSLTLVVPPLDSGEDTIYSLNDIEILTENSVIICADVDFNKLVPESSETNNRRCHTAQLQQDMQDLTIGTACLDHSTSPFDPSVPGTISITSKIINSGNVDISNDIEVLFTNGTDSVISTITGGIATGNNTTISGTLPLTTLTGTTFIVVVDPEDLILETNETNNGYSNQLCFDFAPSQILGNSSYPTTTGFTPQANIRNNGILRTSQIQAVRIEVSGPGITGWLTLYSGSSTISGTCGSGVLISAPNIFIAPQEGDYVFRVTADENDEFIECNETNNVSLRTIQFANPPDYRTLSQYIAPSSLNPNPGDSITIDVSYDNLGLSNLDSINLEVLVDDILLEKKRVKGLVANDLNSVSISMPWTSNLAGTHVIRLVSNSDQENFETTFSNNEATRSIIVGAAPNFLITDLSSTIPSPLQGFPTTIVAEITNEGGAAGSAQLVLSYIDLSDAEIIIDTIDFNIVSQQEGSLSKEWTPPISGQIEVLARIVNSNPFEYNELDNDTSIVLPIQMTDTEDPDAICQDINIYLDSTGQSVLLASEINNGSTDNHVIDSLSISKGTFDCSDLGDHQVVLTIWDASGNSNSCTATVTVVDTIAPIAICMDTVVYLDALGNAQITVNHIEKGSTDNCGLDSMFTSQTSFNCNDLGDQNVLLTVVDQSGNSNVCVGNVTVMDTIVPIASCRDTMIYLDSMGNAILQVHMLENGSTDNCGINSSTISKSNFDCNDLGGQVITVKVFDESSNVDSCVATVTVLDTIAPVMDCADLTIYLDEQGNYALTNSDVDSLMGRSEDNCDIDSILLSSYNLDCSDLQETNILITVWDASLNSNSCVTRVTVIDTFGPIVECQDIELELTKDRNAVIEPADAIASIFDCQLESSNLSRDSFYCADIGIVPDVILTAIDSSGNSSVCEFDITINDPHGYCCPDSLNVNYNPIDPVDYYASAQIYSAGYVTDSSDINFRSRAVLLDSLFEVQQGGTLQIINEDCSNQ